MGVFFSPFRSPPRQHVIHPDRKYSIVWARVLGNDSLVPEFKASGIDLWHILVCSHSCLRLLCSMQISCLSKAHEKVQWLQTILDLKVHLGFMKRKQRINLLGTKLCRKRLHFMQLLAQKREFLFPLGCKVIGSPVS